MKKIAIIQARYGSSRLPGKVLKLLNGKPVLFHIIDRLKRCKNLDDIIVATTINIEDNIIVDFCNENNVKHFRGNENNVLERFYNIGLFLDADLILRFTADCPLVDFEIVDDMINNFLENKCEILIMEYMNNNSYTFPDGFDCEIFDFKTLKKTYNLATNEKDKEHVTLYMKRHFKYDTYKINLLQEYENLDLGKLHLSLDTEKDYKLLLNIFNNMKNYFSMEILLKYLNNNPDLLENTNKINIFQGKGQKLYKEAKKIIPGGTQLLSKRPEMFLPDLWPTYYQKAFGIEITTLDGIKIKDFSYMGIGACILGYKDEDVNREVHKAVDRGNISTLNCPSEVELTKLLLKLHPWAEMARYTRASGEACAMAVRIGRASSKKDKIAFCGYHGWHDWYLASNWNNGDDLKNHLLSGLSPNGVPKNLKDTAFPFNYNKIEELVEIIVKQDIGVVIMEPQRSEPPKDNFLHKVRELCDLNNIILIFDEVSSAFRINTGGIHLTYNVTPDIAIFGKSLGNGYPIAAVIGKKQYMDSAQDTFISSTFFTEDIGFTAAIAMINKHKKYEVGNHINNLGLYFQKELQNISEFVGIKISISGLSAFSAWSFDYQNSLAIKTLYIQKMLERGILAKNAFYLSFAHKKEDVDFYLENIREVFIELLKLIDLNKVECELKGPLCHTDFKRLV